jgi:hypothetical protein
LKTLAERYPRKSDLVNALMDVLPLEKESVYRRLRKDILFTSEEMLSIAGAWKISLDNIISTTPHKTCSFHFSMMDHINPQEADYKLFEKFNHIMELVVKDPEGKTIEVSNTLTGSLYLGYENLTRFFTMKWLYKFDSSENTPVFGKIHVPEPLRELEREYCRLVRNTPEVYAIYDSRFIENLTDDIQYFKSIRMITEEDVVLLKDDLMKLVNYMEEVALKGYFPETGNKLFFYVSHTCLETEYFLCGSKYLTLSMVKVLERGCLASLDKKVFDKFENMVQFAKSSSVLLSANNNLQIIEFFEKQKNIIASLK